MGVEEEQVEEIRAILARFRFRVVADTPSPRYCS